MKLNNIINELISFKYENEWFEFKENMKSDNEIGEYISALSNGAAYLGKDKGYLIWGVNNSTHKIVGTDFNPDCNTAHNEPLKYYLERLLYPHTRFNNIINKIRYSCITWFDIITNMKVKLLKKNA